MVGFVGKTQSIVVGFVVKAQRIVVECLRLDSGFPIITADFAQSLRAPSLRQQLDHLSTAEMQNVGSQVCKDSYVPGICKK